MRCENGHVLIFNGVEQKEFVKLIAHNLFNFRTEIARIDRNENERLPLNGLYYVEEANSS